jgi:hypothetical protein
MWTPGVHMLFFDLAIIMGMPFRSFSEGWRRGRDSNPQVLADGGFQNRWNSRYPTSPCSLLSTPRAMSFANDMAGVDKRIFCGGGGIRTHVGVNPAH